MSSDLSINGAPPDVFGGGGGKGLGFRVGVFSEVLGESFLQGLITLRRSARKDLKRVCRSTPSLVEIPIPLN